MAAILVFLVVLDNGNRVMLGVAFVQSMILVFNTADLFEFWYQSRLESKVSVSVRTVGYLITAVYKIAILVFQKSIYWFAFTNTLDMIIAFIFLMIVYKKSGGQKLVFNINTGKKMLKISYNFIVSGLMVAVYAQMDKIMLGKMLDTYTVGLYSVGIYICSLWNFIPDSMIASLRPGVMEAKKVSEEIYRKKLKQMYALIIWISILYATCVCIFSKYIILILYGKDYLGARTPLMIAVWYCGFSLMGRARDVWIICEGHQKYSKWFALIGAVTNFGLNLLLIPRIGMIGAAIATLTTQIMTGFIVTLFFKNTRENNKFLIEAFMLKGVK